MIHAGVLVSNGGGSGGTATVAYSPPPGTYSGTGGQLLITMTVTHADKLRYHLGTDAWTTVNATSKLISLKLTDSGDTLWCDALSNAGAILASKNGKYFKA